MYHGCGLFYLMESKPLVQLHCGREIRVGLKVQLPVAGFPRPVFHKLNELSAVSPALDFIYKIQLLQFRTVRNAGKLRRAGSADDLTVFVQRYVVYPVSRAGIIKFAQPVKFRVKVYRPGNVKMEFLQIRTDYPCNYLIVRSLYFSVIQHFRHALIIFVFSPAGVIVVHLLRLHESESTSGVKPFRSGIRPQNVKPYRFFHII